MSTTVLTDYGPPSPTESWTVADIKAMIERKEPFWAQPLRWPTPATISIIAWLSPSIPGPTVKSINPHQQMPGLNI